MGSFLFFFKIPLSLICQKISSQQTSDTAGFPFIHTFTFTAFFSHCEVFYGNFLCFHNRSDSREKTQGGDVGKSTTKLPDQTQTMDVILHASGLKPPLISDWPIVRLPSRNSTLMSTKPGLFESLNNMRCTCRQDFSYMNCCPYPSPASDQLILLS